MNKKEEAPLLRQGGRICYAYRYKAQNEPKQYGPRSEVLPLPAQAGEGEAALTADSVTRYVKRRKAQGPDNNVQKGDPDPSQLHNSLCSNIVLRFSPSFIDEVCPKRPPIEGDMGLDEAEN